MPPSEPHNAAEPPRFKGPGDLDRALALVRFLRANCPWDAKQTARSLVPHLLEEAHEVADAVHDGDVLELEGELGDLLLNLAFQIVVAEEAGSFDAAAVYGRLEAKMVRRHPHLFGDGTARLWEETKAEERAPGESALDGLARGLDPLTKAYRAQEKAAGVGFDWPDHEGAMDKVAEEVDEVRAALASGDPDELADEVGDLLFAAVNVARLVGVHPTTALAAANRKFVRRFQALEERARDEGLALPGATLGELDAVWEVVKEDEE